MDDFDLLDDAPTSAEATMLVAVIDDEADGPASPVPARRAAGGGAGCGYLLAAALGVLVVAVAASIPEAVAGPMRGMACGRRGIRDWRFHCHRERAMSCCRRRGQARRPFDPASLVPSAGGVVTRRPLAWFRPIG